MSLESSVAEVLRNDPAARISFKIDGMMRDRRIEVDKTQMEGVAAAIEHQDVLVTVGDPGGFGAAYSSWRTRRIEPGERRLIGKLTVRNVNVVNSVLGRAAVFHESVHALMDVNNYRVSMHDDEVIAYLADATYLKASNLTNLAGGPQELAIYAAAFALVDRRRLLATPGALLSAADCEDLRSAIRAHPLYQGG
jgi:hypothetical protein